MTQPSKHGWRTVKKRRARARERHSIGVPPERYSQAQGHLLGFFPLLSTLDYSDVAKATSAAWNVEQLETGNAKGGESLYQRDAASGRSVVSWPECFAQVAGFRVRL